jgi:hypothetical protein
MPGSSNVIAEAQPGFPPPGFTVEESFALGLSEAEIDRSVKAVINYQVIERTKSYTVIRIHNMTINKSRRRY